MVKSLLPVGYESYWFLTAYVGMFLLIPLMNSAIRAISHKRLLVVVASLLLAYSMYPTLLARDVFSTGNGYSVWWLLILYLVGATLRAYERDVSIRGRWIALAYLGLGVVTWLSHPIRSVLEDILPLHVISLVNYTSPSVVGMAVALVLLFARLHVPEWARRSIELITQLSFSVYLIHVHPLMVEPLGAVFARLPLANPVPAPLVVVLAAIAVYVVCLLIDYPREMMFKKLGITRRLREAEEWIEERLRQGKR